MSVYTIREVIKDDLESVREIYSQYIDKHIVIDHLVQRVLQAIGTTSELHCFVAAEDGVVVGLIGFQKPHQKLLPFTHTKNPVELYSFFVREKRNGVGKFLLKKMVEVAKEKAYLEVVLYSGNQWKDSWSFYDHMGFERIGTLESATAGTAQIFLINLWDIKCGGWFYENDTGYYGELTEVAVSYFREAYKESVLNPWGFAEETRCWYQTILKKANDVFGHPTEPIVIDEGVCIE